MIYKIVERYQVEIQAFVLMSNHYHLLISTPAEPLSVVMRYFMTEASRAIGRRADRRNHVFGVRHKWSLLPDAQAVAYMYKYIYRNPVKAGMVSRCEDYRYSSYHPDACKELPMVERIDETWAEIPKDVQSRSAWLNAPTRNELESLIRLASRRATFAFSKDKKVQLKLPHLRSSYLTGCEK